MAKYQHKRGVIQDNALQAVLYDPLFKQRIEKSRKGKGSYQRKEKHVNKGSWESSGKRILNNLTTALLFR